MLILTRTQIKSLLTMTDAIRAVEDGFRQLAAGQVVMPQRAATPLAPYNGLHLSMPAFVGGDPGALSVKLVAVYPDNPAHHGLPMIQGLLLLHDATNGKPLALMDAEHLTAVRTGAASGVATRYLARPDAMTVTLFGAGAQLAAVCAVRPIRRAWVLTRTGQREAEFCARMADELALEVTATHDVRLAVETADILCTATNAQTPLFDGAWLRPGVHINAIGAYTRTMRELDAVAISRSRLFVDHHTAAQTEAGDILLAIAEGAIMYSHIAGELGDVVTGQIAGRLQAADITIFKSVGLAMQDAVTAARVYALAVAQGVGTEVDWR